MKKLLEYYYNIFPDNVYETNNVCYFFIDDIKYYFIVFRRNIEDLNELVLLSNNLYSKGIKVHTFIKTKDNKFYVNNDKNNYVLLRVNCDENEEIDLYDIIKFNSLEITNDNKLNKISTKKRWENTVDTFERQMSELNNEFPRIMSVFDYYVGLSENAISYINDLENNSDVKYLSHKRIKSPLTHGMIYNPLSFIFDYKTRDLSEYIKEKFFFDYLDEEEIFDFINKNINYFNISDIKLLYARLMFPTYYFDLFESVLNNEKKDDEIEKIIKLSNHYELFLKELYFNLKDKYNIEPIDWIVNKK